MGAELNGASTMGDRNYLDEFYGFLREDVWRYFHRPIEAQLDYLSADVPLSWESAARHVIFSKVNLGKPQTILDAYRHNWYSAMWLLDATKAPASERYPHVVDSIRRYVVGRTFLEVGYGAGFFTMEAANVADATYACDLSTVYSTWFAWRIQHHGWPIRVFSVDDELPLRQLHQHGSPMLFDFILSHEILEHHNNPVKAVWEMVCHLRMGGLLYLSTFFNNINGQDPTHLEYNQIYQDSYLWESTLRILGLGPAENNENGVLKIYRKEREPQWNLPNSHGMHSLWRKR